jgi:hypothetical protein
MTASKTNDTSVDKSGDQDDSTEQPTTLRFVDRVSFEVGSVTQRGKTEYTGWQIDDLPGEAIVEHTSDVVIVNLGMDEDSHTPRAVTDLHIPPEKAREMAETLEKAADTVEGEL